MIYAPIVQGRLHESAVQGKDLTRIRDIRGQRDIVGIIYTQFTICKKQGLVLIYTRIEYHTVVEGYSIRAGSVSEQIDARA